MAEKRKRRKKAEAGSVLLGIVLSLALAGALIVGASFWAAARPKPAALRDEKIPGRTVVELYASPEAVTGEAPAAAAAPEIAAESSGTEGEFAEIIGQEEGLTVARIQGKRWRGFIALVEDPDRLYVATCPYFSESTGGRRVDQMADEHGAVLAVNGGGFMDVGGVGAGGMPIGNVVSEGQMLWPGGGSTVAMDYDGVIHVGEISGNACRDAGFRWALSYGPTLIENGEIRAGLDDYQQEPRTAVGQRSDGTVVIVNIQGRQASALGVTCQELAEILFSYGCINAGNLDGGASADMYYRGEYVNICNISSGPRPIPTALLVLPLAPEFREEAQG